MDERSRVSILAQVRQARLPHASNLGQGPDLVERHLPYERMDRLSRARGHSPLLHGQARGLPLDVKHRLRDDQSGGISHLSVPA